MIPSLTQLDMLRRHGRNRPAPAGLAALVPLPSPTRLRSAPPGNPLSPQSISARSLQRRECRAHGQESYSLTIAGPQIYQEIAQPFPATEFHTKASEHPSAWKVPTKGSA